MWGKIIIPMYKLWLHGLYGLYGARCSLSPKRPINLISLSLSTPWQFDYLSNSLFRITLTENIKAPHYWPWFQQSSVDSLLKWPVIFYIYIYIYKYYRPFEQGIHIYIYVFLCWYREQSLAYRGPKLLTTMPADIPTPNHMVLCHTGTLVHQGVGQVFFTCCQKDLTWYLYPLSVNSLCPGGAI